MYIYIYMINDKMTNNNNNDNNTTTTNHNDKNITHDTKLSCYY